jgi:hypothetical protein
MPDIHQMLMPDPVALKASWPPQYQLSDYIVRTIRSFYGNMSKVYAMCGSDDKTTPTLSDAPRFPGSQAAAGAGLFANYASTVVAMNQMADGMTTTDKNIVTLVQKQSKFQSDAQTTINAVVDQLSEQASVKPPGYENDYVTGYLADGQTAYDKAYTQLTGSTGGNADQITALTDEVNALKAQLAADEKTIKGLSSQSSPGSSPTSSPYDPTPATQISSTPTSSATTPYSGYTPISTGISDLGSTSSSTDPYGTGTGTGTTGTSTDPYGTGSGTDTGSTATPASYGASTPSSSGTDLSSLMSMLPMLMEMMQNRQMTDPNQNTDPYANDPYGRYGQYPEYAQAQPAQQQTQPAQSTPQSAPATQGPTSGATSDQPANNAPAGRTPGPDGTVTYTFPDGQTQKVSVTVAKALDAAFGNQKDTDAQAAYAGTSAKWTDKKQIGTRVDPYQLMTGDIATWENATAIVRVMGSGTDGTLDVIVDGQLKPFAPDMSGAAGEFGEFTGFQHPNGIEVGNATDTSGTGSGTAAVPGDPSGGAASAAVPAATAPA